MSAAPVIINDRHGDAIWVQAIPPSIVFIGTTMGVEKTGVVLSVDQCAALIAAITDAAKVVTGDKS